MEATVVAADGAPLGVDASNGMGVRVSVVIPALNEADNLPHVLPRIPRWVHEVLVVDGNSTDGTADIATSLLPQVRIVRQSGKGKGDALRAGFASATGDVIVMLDADGSMSPQEIPLYVGALLAGADMAKGSRFVQGGGTRDMPFYRRWGNQAFILMVNLLFGGRYSDLCYGYSAFWRDLVPGLGLECDGFEVETVLNIRALRANWRVWEVPSFEAPRVHGTGRLRTIPDGWRVLTSIFREARDHYLRRGNLRALDIEPTPELARETV
jgi:glycosyltransferase involved in cell wall biosynthesis